MYRMCWAQFIEHFQFSAITSVTTIAEPRNNKNNEKLYSFPLICLWSEEKKKI